MDLSPWDYIFGRPPSGSDTESARAFFEWNFSQYVQLFPVDRWTMQWTPVFWLLLWGIVLTAGFFAFAWFFRRVHRSHGELYGITSFNGYLFERIGSISWFSWIIWGMVTAAALFYVITHALYGQAY